MFIKKIKKNKGFALLFSVMLSSIILAITLGIANISFREIKFSTSGKDTNDAFFAADTGAECALYNDKASSLSFVETTEEITASGTIECLGETIDLNGEYPVWNFVISGLGNEEKGCAKVNVDKSDSIVTTITSKGYNNGGSDCEQDSNSVERVLELNY